MIIAAENACCAITPGPDKIHVSSKPALFVDVIMDTGCQRQSRSGTAARGSNKTVSEARGGIGSPSSPYVRALRTYAQAGNSGGALQVLAEMKQRGGCFSPLVGNYNSCLEVCGQ